MPPSQDDPAQTADPIHRGGHIARRRGLLALVGSALAIRPLANGQAHSLSDMEEEASAAMPSPALTPAFAERLTEARAQTEWANFKLRFIQPMAA